MNALLRRLRRHRPFGVSFCEPCAEACTPACRSAARLDHARTHAVQHLLAR
ncbi:MAG TPA: hypothetical protein VHN80_14285 [Kineosporiaceae bacterium]|nr:hypothetical protein [Kineosporiaceae bacterium]